MNAPIPQWIYLLRLIRPGSGEAMTDEERAIVGRHFEYLKRANTAGQLVLAGPCEDYAFGVVVFEAADEAEARSFMESDPAVAEKIMSAELHLFRVSLMRGMK